MMHLGLGGSDPSDPQIKPRVPLNIRTGFSLIIDCFFPGELQLPLNSVDLAGPVEEWKDLAPVDDGSNQYLGDLCLSLRYVPSSGKLTGMHTQK